MHVINHAPNMNRTKQFHELACAHSSMLWLHASIKKGGGLVPVHTLGTFGTLVGANGGVEAVGAAMDTMGAAVGDFGFLCVCCKRNKTVQNCETLVIALRLAC